MQKLPSDYLTDPSKERFEEHICFQMKHMGKTWFDDTRNAMTAVLPIEREGSMCPTKDDPEFHTPCRDSDFDRVFRSYSSELWSHVCMYKLLLRRLGRSSCEDEVKTSYEDK